jgi:hypothetical protein
MGNAEVIARLKWLQDERGGLDPRAVVEDAKNPESPLHTYFEWDTEKAAESYWLIQARSLIRSVRLVVSEEKISLSTIAYVRDPEKGRNETGYVSTTYIRTDKEKARQALMQELSRAESAVERAYNVADSLGLADEVSFLLAQIRGIRSAA